MSKEALAKVVQRAISDAGFRRQLNSDPAGALRGFDLSADEVSALRMGDAGRLSTLGIDQRMSKSFVLGGVAAATRSSQADLASGTPAMVDDASGAGSRTVIPADPDHRAGSADASGGSEAVRSADIDPGSTGAKTVRAGDDWKFAGRVAPEGASTVRVGDDWKFADRASQGGVAPVEGSPEASAAENAAAGGTARTGDDWKFADRAPQGSVAPVEGSPEASAADIARGGSMAAYPAHDGLAGPSGAQSVRAGDDWARSSQAAADSARIGNARLDDSSGGASGGANAVNDDPDGFLAANKNADFNATRSAVNDDPDGFLAANKNADLSGTVRSGVNDDPDGFLAANKNADLSGASKGGETAFIDESESYLTKVGYDPDVTNSAVTDAHDRTWSGDDIAGPSSVESDAEGGTDHGTDGGPNITP
jgi:hypothetical protein